MTGGSYNQVLLCRESNLLIFIKILNEPTIQHAIPLGIYPGQMLK